MFAHACKLGRNWAEALKDRVSRFRGLLLSAIYAQLS